MLGGGPLGGGGFGEFPCVITETRSSRRLDGGGPSVERADDEVVRADDVVLERLLLAEVLDLKDGDRALGRADGKVLILWLRRSLHCAAPRVQLAELVNGW